MSRARSTSAASRSWTPPTSTRRWRGPASTPRRRAWRSKCARSATDVTADVEIARVFREEHGRAVAVLARVFGDLEIAEDAVQEAFAAAVERWPTDGIPPSPS